jgi:Family of unknown function (DUF6789)
MRTDISITDRIGNGIVAGFIATLVLSVLHEPVVLLTAAAGMDAPATGWLFHFFVGTLLWGGTFGIVHDYLFGPPWLRGIAFAAIAWLIVMLAVMPAADMGLFGLAVDVALPITIAAFHLLYGVLLGVVYGKLVDTDEARAHDIHAHH